MATVGLVAVVVGVASALTSPVPALPTPLPRPASSLPPAGSADLFVSPSGNDANAGTDATPLQTVQAAIQRVQPGATIWLQSGSYAPFTITASNASPITIAARSSGAATIDGHASPAAITLRGARNVTLLNLTVLGGQGQALAGVLLDHADGIDIEGTTVRDTTGGFGIEARYSANVTIRANDIGHNAVGIRLYGQDDSASVHDVLIEGNWIHDSDSMVVNDPAPDNDFGANGIIWHAVSGTTIARDNQVWSSRAPSHDYGVDGSAFEVWDSSNLQILGNRTWDDVNVLETGSDGPPCDRITFLRNVAFGAGRDGVGLILRCASNGLFAHNVIDGLRGYAFELSDRGSGNHFAKSIDGLQLLDNIIVGTTPYVVRNQYSGHVTADHNLFWDTGGPLAHLPGGGSASSIADLTTALGFDADSLVADPRFVDPDTNDYRVLVDSPAIDRGTPAPPDETFQGAAPDIGAYEGGVPLPTGSGLLDTSPDATGALATD